MTRHIIKAFFNYSLLATVVFLSPQINPTAMAQATCELVHLKRSLGPEESRLAAPTPEFGRLQGLLQRLAPLSQNPDGPPLRMLMGVVEIGRIPGLKTVDGRPLNLSVGGIGTVMNDTWSEMAPILARRGIEPIAVTPLMGNVSKEGMHYLGKVQVRVDGHNWDVNLYEHQLPKGGRIIFLENENYTRHFSATPPAGQNIYHMQNLPAGPEGDLQRQRIWSSLSQAVEKVYARLRADLYVPQDGHLAPASFYINRGGHEAISLAPKFHNERYLDTFWVQPGTEGLVGRIWNVDPQELTESFMHGDHVVMPAPAVRTAERTGVFTGKSVANNTTRILNRDGLPPEAFPQMQLYSRLAPEENFLASGARPNFNRDLARASAEDLHADGITVPEVVEQFASEHAYQFGFPGQGAAEIWAGKARAKRAVQQLFGMDVDPNKPLFVAFARMVDQKGMDFLVPNIRRILERGGQVVVGGPAGDASGAATQRAFRELAEQLQRERPDLARNFHFIDGPVMGRRKALLLAGNDFFPVPSRFEPCGLTDVEALFNGGQPIAPRIGGLVKGRNTINYRTRNPENQTEDLGWAIDQALNLYQNYHPQFQRRQIAAMQEDFSLVRHLDQSMLNNRVEVYARMIRHLDQLVQDGAMTVEQAHAQIRQNIEGRYPNDSAFVRESLSRLSPIRRTPLMDWYVHQ